MQHHIDLAAVRDIAGQLKSQAAQFRSATSVAALQPPAWFPAEIGERVASDQATAVATLAELADRTTDIACGLEDHSLVVDAADSLPTVPLKVEG